MWNRNKKGNQTMMKYAIAAAVAGVMITSPAFAASKLKCNQASMKKVDGMIHEMMADTKMKKQTEMAMGESEMAMKAKKAHDMKGCAMHLNMAQDDLMSHN
jgi:hypothetical protein